MSDEAGESPSVFHVADEVSVYKGRRLAVYEAAVEGPDGERHQREIIHHPGAVGILPLHDDGTVTLVRQYRAALDRDIWEIPAGLRDVEGEPTVETARRELMEEAGLAATTFRHLITFHNTAGFADEATTVYLATDLNAVPDNRQGAEEQHMLVARMPLDEALAMVDDGRITDAKTVIALLLTSRSSWSGG
jgi:8-oxo-dGTP pyrophosphatase MutT (NUDIX family)